MRQLAATLRTLGYTVDKYYTACPYTRTAFVKTEVGKVVIEQYRHGKLVIINASVNNANRTGSAFKVAKQLAAKWGMTITGDSAKQFRLEKA